MYCKTTVYLLIDKQFHFIILFFFSSNLELYTNKMNSLVIKFVQLFSIAFLFDNVKCNPFFLGNAEDDILNREAGCMVICMKTNVIAVSVITLT